VLLRTLKEFEKLLLYKNDNFGELMKKIQEQINKIKKSITNQNITNTSMSTYGKLKEIEHSLYRYDQLSKAGLKEDAQKESKKVNNLMDSFNATEDGEPLKGYISNTRYVWHASGDKPCELCEELDGTEFESIDDISEKPHPNCNCYIEEIEDENDENSNGDGGDEPCDCYETVSGWLDECVDACGEYEDSADEGDNALEELK
jgi:hypothetical protein